jgi:WD40 repeat protein
MLDQANPLIYKVGGSLAFNHPTYVIRKADKELLTTLENGKFCYVFNCRQMGKSSLRVQAMHHLQAQKMDCASIDITSLGSDLDQTQWYNGIMTQLFLGFSLSGKVNLKNWLRERENISPVQKLSQFIEEIILIHTKGKKVFIFIDEIDKVLSLKFSLDDFFSLIRFCYNQRAEDPRYDRLCVALFGVATPSDLIREKTQTPFNIGQAIELTGFSSTEIQPLAIGLDKIADNSQLILQLILDWTGGQPFLTQKVCYLLFQLNQYITTGTEKIIVEQVIQDQMIHFWESQDEPVHLKTIRDRLLRDEQKIGRLLGLYQQILKIGFITTDDSPEQSELRLSGLVVKRDGKLIPYNRIYQSVFSLDWVNKELEKIRPYSESILAWETSNFEDQSRLLRGQALKDALHWSANKNLSNADYKFLNASQNLEQQEAEKNNSILQIANQKAQRRIYFGSAILLFSILGSIIAIGLAGIASQKQIEARRGTELQRIADSAERQFSFEEINGLLSAMQAGQNLKKMVKKEDVLKDYPATSPLLSLQQILNKIQEKNNLQGHKEGVTGVAFSPDSQKLVTTSNDQTSKLWTIQGKLLTTFVGHKSNIYSVSFSPDGQTIATASKDQTIKLWNLQGQVLRTFTGHQDSVYSVTFSPNGQYLASSSRDKTVRLWDLQGNTIAILKGHQKSIDDVQFSPDGKNLVTISRDGMVKLWNLQGQLLQTWGDGKTAFFGVSFSPKGDKIAVAADDTSIKLWNLQGQLLTTLKGHQELVTSVVFSPDGQRLISSSSDGTAKIWNLQGLELKTLRGHQEGVLKVAVDRTGRHIATASEDGTVKLWDLTPKPTLGFRAQDARLTGVAISPAQSLLAVVTEDKPLSLINFQGQLQQTFPITTAGITQLSFSPDGQRLATTSGGKIVKIWNLQGKLLGQFSHDSGRIYNFAWSGDSQLLAIATKSGKVSLWKVGQMPPTRLLTIQVSQNRVYGVSFNPKYSQLATASEDKTAKIWDLKGNLLTTLKDHQDSVYQVIFSPTGNYLLTASRDGTAKLWNNQGQLLKNLQGDPFSVQYVNFSPDEKWIAIASSDGTIRLWDIQGNLRGEFKGQETSLMALAFTANNEVIITVDREGTVREWPVESELPRLTRLLKEGCQWLDNYLQTHPQERKKLPICSP